MYYILGNSGFAYELFEQIFLHQKTDKIFGGFIVLKDNKAILISDKGTEPFTYSIEAKFILGTGNKKWRNIFIEHFLKYYKADINHFPNVLAKSTHISKLSAIGIGNVFCSFSMLNGTAIVGNFNLFNVYSTASHNSALGDYNIFCPKSSAMGNTTMKDFNFLAAGATICPSISIGSHNILSAGEYLLEDMKDKQFFQSGLVTDKL